MSSSPSRLRRWRWTRPASIGSRGRYRPQAPIDAGSRPETSTYRPPPRRMAPRAPLDAGSRPETRTYRQPRAISAPRAPLDAGPNLETGIYRRALGRVALRAPIDAGSRPETSIYRRALGRVALRAPIDLDNLRLSLGGAGRVAFISPLPAPLPASLASAFSLPKRSRRYNPAALAYPSCIWPRWAAANARRYVGRAALLQGGLVWENMGTEARFSCEACPEGGDAARPPRQPHPAGLLQA